MDKYILVKVRDADKRLTPKSIYSNLGWIRKAIHKASADHDISMADMVTHTEFMTPVETEKVKAIFETAMARAKRNHQRRLEEEWNIYYGR